MARGMTIGEFSRATRLTAKALRHYHRLGLLEPAAVDGATGYRLYDAAQIADAQVVRRLRDLEVPVATVRLVLAAPDVAGRHELFAAHLADLEARLEQTRASVTALRGLLGRVPVPLAVEHRSVPATPALVVREVIDLEDLGAWYDGALVELGAASRAPGVAVAGARGGLWGQALVRDGRGEAVLFQPVARVEGLAVPVGRVRAEVLPAVDLAVVVHRGPDEGVAQAYAALGAHVAAHEIGLDGPARETYLQEATPGGSGDVVTEVGWPVFRAGR